MKKLANIYEFHKSTLAANFAVSLVTYLFGNIQSVLFVFISFGFFISLAFKEAYRKNDYLFYENNGISKIKLCFCAYFLNLMLSTFIFLLYRLTISLF